MMSASHAVYFLWLHIVFVTQYRRKTLTPELVTTDGRSLHEILGWCCILLEFEGEADHVHLLGGIRPPLNFLILINNLKSASARRMRNRFADH